MTKGCKRVCVCVCHQNHLLTLHGIVWKWLLPNQFLKLKLFYVPSHRIIIQKRHSGLISTHPPQARETGCTVDKLHQSVPTPTVSNEDTWSEGSHETEGSSLCFLQEEMMPRPFFSDPAVERVHVMWISHSINKELLSHSYGYHGDDALTGLQKTPKGCHQVYFMENCSFCALVLGSRVSTAPNILTKLIIWHHVVLLVMKSCILSETPRCVQFSRKIASSCTIIDPLCYFSAT